MSDDSVKTISGLFASREAADRAVEHLVQEHGIARSDVFLAPAGGANSAGTARSGGDAAADPAEGSGFDPALAGAIVVSADIGGDEAEKAEKALRAIGARSVSLH